MEEGPICSFEDLEDTDAIILHEIESIEESLERMVRLDGFSWSANQAIGSCIAIYDMPGSIINKSSFIRDKLNNFAYLRCDLEISIRMNGTAFHYGKLLLSWDPMYRCMDTKTLDRVSNLYTASGGPFVIASPTENKVVEFTIPFIFPYYYLMIAEVGPTRNAVLSSMGALRVFVLNPLQQYSTAPSNPVGVTVFARMFNVSVQGFTPANLSYDFPPLPLPTVNTYPSVDTMCNLTAGFEPQVLGSLTSPEDMAPTSSRVFAPRAVATGKNIIAKGKGLFDKFKSKVSRPRDPEASAKSRAATTNRRTERATKILDKLSKIPVIGKFAKVASVAAKIIGKIKAKFGGRIRARRARRKGRTRPNAEQTEQNVVPRLFNLAHTHGLNMGPILGLWPDSIIDEHFDFIGSHEDEMDLDYVCSTPSLAGILTWTSNQTEGMPIPSSWIPVTPMLGDQANGKAHSTVLAWTSLPFRYWRGAIRIMFQITCSSFHAGRLAIAWIPGEGRYNSNNATIDSVLDKASTRIIDIKTECEVGVTFPYFSMKPWLLTSPIENNSNTSSLSSSSDLGSTHLRQTYNSGIFNIFVVNALTHSENPVPPVYINIWVSGGEDFQLAFPTNASLTNEPFTNFQPQSFMREDIRGADYPPILDMSTIPDLGISVPEAPVHLKDVLMRFTRTEMTADDNDLIIFNPLAAWDSLEFEHKPMPYYIWYESLFRFRRGSFDIKVTWTDNTPIEIPRYLALDVQPVKGLIQNNPGTWIKKNNTTTVAENSLLSQGAIMVKEPVSNSLEGTIPYYCTSLCDVIGRTASNDLLDTMTRSTGVVGQVGGAGSVNLSLYTCAGDSYHLGFITGAPTTQLKTE